MHTRSQRDAISTVKRPGLPGDNAHFRVGIFPSDDHNRASPWLSVAVATPFPHIPFPTVPAVFGHSVRDFVVRPDDKRTVCAKGATPVATTTPAASHGADSVVRGLYARPWATPGARIGVDSQTAVGGGNSTGGRRAVKSSFAWGLWWISCMRGAAFAT